MASASAACFSRGSITRPAHSLSTLRGHGRPYFPRKTRFRLVISLCRAARTSPARHHQEVSATIIPSSHRFLLLQACPGALSPKLRRGVASSGRGWAGGRGRGGGG